MTKKIIPLNIYKIIGNEFCISADDGEKVFKKLKQLIKEKCKIEISFKNIKILNTAFLNSAIGDMYKDHAEDMKKYCSVIDMDDVDKIALKNVIENAKAYYRDPKLFTKSIEDILNS